MNWQGQHVLVLGLGSSGYAAAVWLARRGAQVRVADQSTSPPMRSTLQAAWPQILIRLGGWAEEDSIWAEQIVISPGVPMADPFVRQAIARGVPVMSDIEVFARAVPGQARVIAITGSNGKSTVTSMVAEMVQACGLKTRLAGNIGLPALQVLDEAPDTQVYVLELSSFQLEAVSSLHCDAAVVLNLSEDHLDRYPDMAAYAAAKARIYRMARVQVINRDDAGAAALANSVGQVVRFGLEPPERDSDFGVRDGRLCRGGQVLWPVKALRVTGRHNVANALAAWALCHALDLPDGPLGQALGEFRGLPHRVQWVARIGDVEFYDDSKGTNVGATEAAVRGMDRPVVLIAGGEGKGQDFAPLAQAAAGRVRAMVLIGRDAPQIAAALEGSGIALAMAGTMGEAVAVAAGLAKPGDAVLLSPACASFDMFDNYAHRAQVFVAAVTRLAEGRK